MNDLVQRTSPESLPSAVVHAAVSRRESLRTLALLSMAAALPARSVGAAATPDRPHAPPPGDTVIDLPFAMIRLLLPMDGLPPLDVAARPIQARNTISFLIGDENRWPGRTEFERHEMAELAFGYVLRAKEEDRDKSDGERPIGPGFRDNGDHVLVQGGWRAHKSMKASGDWFDGRFSAKLRYFTENAILRARCEDLKLDWNGSILEFADGKLERQVAQELEVEVNEKLQKEMLDPIAKALRDAEELNMLRERTRIQVVGTTVRLTVATTVGTVA